MTNNQIKVLLPQLRRFAYALCANTADADDLVQQCIEKLWLSPPAAEVPVLAWCFRVIRNQWIDQYRARQQQGIQLAEPEQLEQVPGQSSDPQQQIELQQVGRALQQLPQEQREVLALVAVQGFSYAEAAEMLQVPGGTVMSRLARARQQLARWFAQPSEVTE
ncbi:RNA polymerase sigma factor [Rheinheimera sp.]|uniref:RNA polymerase sigma factor n=1 Tax=Rheinheimera sp. TaxID=1869214 RepID=UPI00307EC2CB